MDIIMVRHTRVGVPKGTCYGWSDVPVADTFEQEATLTKSRLVEVFADGNPDIVYSSPLMRARKLAAFCGYESLVVDDRLKEMNMGEWRCNGMTTLRTTPCRCGMTTTCTSEPLAEKAFRIFMPVCLRFLKSCVKKNTAVWRYSPTAVYCYVAAFMPVCFLQKVAFHILLSVAAFSASKFSGMRP